MVDSWRYFKSSPLMNDYDDDSFRATLSLNVFFVCVPIFMPFRYLSVELAYCSAWWPWRFLIRYS
jgi:hypothetical protein